MAENPLENPYNEIIHSVVDAMLQQNPHSIDIDRISGLITDDVEDYNDAIKNKILQLIENKEIVVEIIDRKVEPMIIIEVARFDRTLRYAVSQTAINKVEKKPDNESLLDEKLAIRAIDEYQETNYGKIFPLGDGYETFKVIKNDHPGKEIKLIKVTNEYRETRGRVIKGIEQRVEFFIYDGRTNTAIMAIL